MSTFKEILQAVLDVCDEKDKRIKFLEGQVEGLRKENDLIGQRFKEGRYDLLKMYFNI